MGNNHAPAGTGAAGILTLPPPPAGLRLPYGRDELQFGELRLPAGSGPHPVVIVVHGGFWRARYDLAHAGHLCAALTGAGVATWNIEYRRLGNPGGGWPGTMLDVARATDVLRRLPASHELALDRVVALGHSAGGHLALWLAARHRLPPDSPLYLPDPLPLRAAVSLAGVNDLRHAWDLQLSHGVVGALLGGSPDEVPDRYAAASPAALLPLGVPQLLLHGLDDRNVPVELSERYARAALARGDPVEFIPFPATGHFELIDPRSRQWPGVERAVLAALAD